MIEWFVLVALAAAHVAALLGIAIGAFQPAQYEEKTSQDIAGPSAALPIRAALVVHQMHYFTYSTLVLLTVISHYGAAMGVIVFLAGWLSYIATPHIIGRNGEPAKIALVGHILLAAVLLSMLLVPANSTLWSTLWVATGFFGGTVVYLTRYAESGFGVSPVELTLLENAGHVCGSALAFALVLGGLPQDLLVAVAAGFAVLTAVLLLASRRATSQRA